MAKIINVAKAKETPIGELIGDYLQLKDMTTSYIDTSNGWCITGDEIKPMPEFISQKMMASVRTGRFKMYSKAEYKKLVKGEG